MSAISLWVVIIENDGQMVMRVDPHTRKATDEPQQFYMEPDGRGFSLQILAREDWIANPYLIKVDSMSGFSARFPETPPDDQIGNGNQPT